MLGILEWDHDHGHGEDVVVVVGCADGDSGCVGDGYDGGER